MLAIEPRNEPQIDGTLDPGNGHRNDPGMKPKIDGPLDVAKSQMDPEMNPKIDGNKRRLVCVCGMELIIQRQPTYCLFCTVLVDIPVLLWIMGFTRILQYACTCGKYHQVVGINPV